MNLKSFLHFFFIILIIALVCSCKSNINDDIAQKQNAPKYYLNLPPSSFTDGNYLKAIHEMDSVFRGIKNPNNWDKQYYYGAFTWINKELNRNELALRYADSSIRVLQQINNKQLTAEYHSAALMQKGIIHIKLGNYNEAYNNFFEAKQVLDFLNDSCSKMGPLDSYGMVLYQQKEYKLAKDAFVDELHLLENCFKKSDPEYGGLQHILDNIALCYTKMNELDSAKKYYLRAIGVIENTRSANFKNDANEQKRFNINLGVISGNLAKVYIHSKPDSAIFLYKRAIALNEKGTSELGDAQLCMFQLANVQLQQKFYADAFITLSKLRGSLDTAANAKAELGYKENLYQYYAATNQYKQAFLAKEDYLHFKDSIAKKEVGINTTNVNKELKDREQQLQIQLLQKDKSINNLYLIIGGIALLLVGIISILLYKNFIKSKKQNQQLVEFNNEIREEKQKTEMALEKLAVSNKEKDRIMNIVAHDLRNPIGAIGNFLEMIQVKYEHSEAEDKILESSKQAAFRSLHLINDLLEANQLQAGDLQLYKTEIDVITIIQQSIEEVKYKAINKQQEIVFNTNTSRFVTSIDGEKVKRVIINLLDNAVKFSYLNSAIIVSCEVLDKLYAISVKDTGMGIPDTIKEHIFDSAITIKRRGTSNEVSNGLGLSIAASIIKAHGGQLRVETKEGEGSVFTIELPTG